MHARSDRARALSFASHAAYAVLSTLRRDLPLRAGGGSQSGPEAEEQLHEPVGECRWSVWIGLVQGRLCASSPGVQVNTVHQLLVRNFEAAVGTIWVRKNYCLTSA